MADAANSAPPSSRFTDLRKRTMTAALLILIVGASLYLGGYVWIMLVATASYILWDEWFELTRGFGRKWQIAGVAYVMPACLSMIALRLYPFTGVESYMLSTLLIIIISATDIGAYFIGRIVGGPKLCPRYSPNKTWAGLSGGMSAATLCGTIFHELTTDHFSLLFIIPLCAVLAIVAQAGDIFESAIKRKAGVKDSGTLLPGHGGLLDRVDGLMFTAPLFLIALWVYG